MAPGQARVQNLGPAAQIRRVHFGIPILKLLFSKSKVLD